MLFLSCLIVLRARLHQHYNFFLWDFSVFLMLLLLLILFLKFRLLFWLVLIYNLVGIVLKAIWCLSIVNYLTSIIFSVWSGLPRSSWCLVIWEWVVVYGTESISLVSSHCYLNTLHTTILSWIVSCFVRYKSWSQFNRLNMLFLLKVSRFNRNIRWLIVANTLLWVHSSWVHNSTSHWL